MMTSKQSTSRSYVGLIAALVMIGAPAFTAAVVPAHAEKYLAKHGYWQGFVPSSADESGFGIVTKMSRGGQLALVAKGDEVSLMMGDPTRHWTVGQTVHIRVTVDGVEYAGEAAAVSSHMVKLTGVSNDVVLRLCHGNEATVDVDKGAIVWTVELDGFASSLTETVKAFTQA